MPRAFVGLISVYKHYPFYSHSKLLFIIDSIAKLFDSIRSLLIGKDYNPSTLSKINT